MVYDTLCLSSGGIYGIAFIGALDYLIEEKILDLNSIKIYVGTSVGAFILFLIMLGNTIKDINRIIININFNKLNTNVQIDNILENFGINNGEKTMFIIKYCLKKKLKVDDITFNELYTKYNKKFTVIGTNFSKGVEEVFNHQNTPDMSVITAIRISISIPLIFMPVLYNNQYYVDGALTNMFPINHCNQETTIAINISYPDNFNINNIFDVLLNSIQIVSKTISCKNKCIIYDNIININPKNNYENDSFFDLNITLEMKINLINIGREITMKHVNNCKLHIKIICSSILNEIIDEIINH